MGRSARPELSLEERLAVVEEAIGSGVARALLTGGEPLVSPQLWPIARRLHEAGVRVLLATNGMLLGAYAAEVGGLFDEVYVSLDGASASTHDGVRGVAAFERLAAGIARLRGTAPRLRVVARSTLHAANVAEFEAIVAAARRLGVHHVSFLPVDASSEAFGGEPAARLCLVPAVDQVRAFESAIDRMAGEGSLADGFVLEDAAALRRIARHLAASAGSGRFRRPACDAPWWSSVVEADGSVRPCFFHAPVGDARHGLAALRSSSAYRTALAHVAAPNPTCTRCVCPKKKQPAPGWASALTWRSA
jgi:MoaA/NifB/PqqE/SkfB family radical SAM enzyme